MTSPPRDESLPPLPRVSPTEAREAALDPAVRYAAARAARAARLEVLESLRADPSRVDAFRAAVACAVADGARRVVVLDAGCVGGALAFEAVRAGAEQVVAFEPDPTLATLVRDTSRQVLPRTADLRRLVVVEADASRAEACSGAGAAWRVRTRDARDGASPSSFVAAEKADCLVLGAFAVADAVEMLDLSRALAALREAGALDALMATGAVFIPKQTRIFAQMIAGSNLGDAARLERLDERWAAPLTRACPAAARERVRARFREDAVTRVSEAFELTEHADENHFSCRRDPGDGRVPPPDALLSSVRSRSFRVTLAFPRAPPGVYGSRPAPETRSEREHSAHVMSWWWMDVGARRMAGGDGRDDARDAVVLSSAPGDAAAAAADRTVTFSPVASPTAVFVPPAARAADGHVASVAARVTVARDAARDGRAAFSVEVESDHTRVEKNKNTNASVSSSACACAAHALWGVDGVARWNDAFAAERLARGVAAVVPRAGADRGALLDLSDGPRMSVLAASCFATNASESPDESPDARAEFSETRRNAALCVERDAGMARFSRGVARASGFEQDAIKVAALDAGGEPEKERFSFLEKNSSAQKLPTERIERREPVPVLEPRFPPGFASFAAQEAIVAMNTIASKLGFSLPAENKNADEAIDAKLAMTRKASGVWDGPAALAALREAFPPKSFVSPTNKKRRTSSSASFGSEKNGAVPRTVPVRVGAGVRHPRDALRVEREAGADGPAADAWCAYRKSRTKADAMRQKLAATRDEYRAAVLAAMAALRLPSGAPPDFRLSQETHEPYEPYEPYETGSSSREGDDFCVAFDAEYDRRRRPSAEPDVDDVDSRRSDPSGSARAFSRRGFICGEDADADAFLFAAYCEGCASLRGSARSNRRRSEAVTAELERLGLGGVDFDEVEADPRVARASATWLALADAVNAAEDAAAENLRRAQEARLNALAAAGRRAAAARAAAESAVGKTPSWVFLCDPFSFVTTRGEPSFEPNALASLETRLEPQKPRPRPRPRLERWLAGRTSALRWGDGALAEALRRRLWAWRAGLLYVNHLAVPREAVIVVAAVSCPGLRARFEPELEATRAFFADEDQDEDQDADEDFRARIRVSDDLDLAATLTRERLARAFEGEPRRSETSVKVKHARDDASAREEARFVPPTPVRLDDVAHCIVSRPTAVARVDLVGDGVDRARFEWRGARVEAESRVGVASGAAAGTGMEPAPPETVVDALVFWTEYDVGDGGPRLSTGPASAFDAKRGASLSRRLLARDAQGALFLDAPVRLAEATSARFRVETRLDVATEGSLGDGLAGHVEARVLSTTAVSGAPREEP